MKNKLLSVLLTLLITVQLVSCNAAETNDMPHEETNEEITAITNIYDPVECVMPDGYSYEESVTPFYDEYTGKLTAVGSISQEETSEDGSINVLYSYKLFTFDLTGEVIGNTAVSSESPAYIEAGVIGKEHLLYIERNRSGSVLVKRDCMSGEIISEISFDELFGAGADYNFTYILEDGGGDIWLGNESIVMVAGDELTVKESFYFTDSVSSLVRGNDGKVYGCLSRQGSKYFIELDKESGEIKEITSVDMAAEKISIAKHTDEDDVGYNFYYNTSDAVYGVRLNSDGSVSEEILLDYANSGIRNNAEMKLKGIAADGSEFSAVYTEDLMLFNKTVYNDGQKIVSPVFYRTAEDIDLAEVTVIEFAHAYMLEDNIYAQIIAYDQAEKDVSVIIHDYSKYNSYEDPDAGAWKLVTDILNGIISPDIVFGNPNDTEITQLVENKLYTDLTPYFESDDTVNPDTVFGCVQNAFTDSEGKMWGITPFFFLSSVLSTNEILGEYADGDTWTLEEFLDFSEQYGANLMFGLTQEFAAEYMESVYGIFCDTENAVCTFDSPLFSRYLEFLKSLPTDEEYERVELGQVAYSDRYYYHKNGTVPLREYSFGEGLLGLKYLFGTDDFKVIGFPTDGDSGAVLFSRMAFVVTDKAENPEACWEFIKAFMHTDYGIWMSGPGTTAMKNLYLDDVMKNRGKMIRKYEDGKYFDDEQAKIYESMGISISTAPYTLEEWDEETIIKGLEYLDSEGMRLSDRLPSAVTDIIYEEISAYLADRGTVDDCAKKIQSRVSIWLSENAD